MSQKIKKLLAIIGAEILVLFLLLWLQAYSGSTANTGADLALSDTTGVDQLRLNGVNMLRIDPLLWINEQVQQPVDRVHAQNCLLGLQRMMVRKPVAQQDLQMVEALFSKAIVVEVLAAGLLRKRIELVSDDSLGTFARLEGQMPFAVYLPGQSGNFAHYYDPTAANWKDKTILRASYRTMNKIRLDYPQRPENSFEISFDQNDNIGISGVQRLDSVKFYKYIVDFQEIRIKEIVEKQSLKDSVLTLTPICLATLEDFDKKYNHNLKVFLTNENKIYVFRQQDGLLGELDWKRMERHFVSKKYFEQSTEQKR